MTPNGKSYLHLVRKLWEEWQKHNDIKIGCLVKLSLMSCCISPRYKVDSSIIGTNTHYENKSTNDISRDQPIALIVSSTTTSNVESDSSTSKPEDNLKLFLDLENSHLMILVLTT